MPSKTFNATVYGEGYYTGDRLWTGEQVNVAWEKMDYNSSNHSLWALDAAGNLQYRSSFNDYAGRYNKADTSLTDYFFESTIEPAGSGNYEVGFFFRFKDRYSFYYLTYNGGYADWGGKNIRLMRVLGSTHTKIADYQIAPFKTGTSYKFRVDLKEGSIKISLNDTLIIDHVDPSPILNGAWGPWVKGQEFVKYKTVTARSNTPFSSSVVLNSNTVTVDNFNETTAKLLDSRPVSEILSEQIAKDLAKVHYESSVLESYKVSSSLSTVKAIFNKTKDLQVTNEPKSLVYAYQVLPTSPPTAPMELVVTDITSSSAKYTWRHADNSEDGFKILDENNNVIATLGEDVTTFTETGLAAGSQYFRKVVAYNTAGNSVSSNLASFATKQVPPVTPEDFRGTVHGTTVTWEWTDASLNEDQFELITWNADGSIKVIAVIDRNQTSYVETKLDPLTEYIRGVRAANTAGKSAPSLPYVVLTKTGLPDVPDEAPADFYGIGISDSEIIWSWQDVTNNETGFNIYDENDTLIAILEANETTFIEAGLVSSMFYHRKIAAFNEGGEGKVSSLASAQTLAAETDIKEKPAAPLNLFSEVETYQKGTITWDYEDNPFYPIDGFKVYDELGQIIIATPPDVREWVFEDLQPARTYHYYVVAYNEAGDGERSNITTMMTPDIEKPDDTKVSLDPLPDPYAGLVYDEEQIDSPRMVAFQSGIGDGLDLKIQAKDDGLGREEFTYSAYLKAYYDEIKEFYALTNFTYQVTCTGIDRLSGKKYEKKANWITGTVNTGIDSELRKKAYISSIAIDVPETVINRRYSVEVRDESGISVPIYNPLSPPVDFNWMISSTTTEETIEDLGAISREDIFNTWGRFSHNTSANQPANLSELKSWKFVPEDQTIRSTINSNTYIGFYSQEKSEKFDLDVKFHVEDPPNSSFQDDDNIAVLIAFAVDEKGREHTLTAMRTNAYANSTWYVVYNQAQKDSFRVADKSSIIPRAAAIAWGKYDIGSRIKVHRDGDKIICDTSVTGSNELVPAATLEIDLSTNPKLEIFRQACSYGLGCHSQENVVFDEVIFTNYLADFSMGADSTLIVWNDALDRDITTYTWRGAKITSVPMTIESGKQHQLEGIIRKPSLEIPWQEIIKSGHDIYGYTLVVESSNPNVEVLLREEVIDFLPEDTDLIKLNLLAHIINDAQTSWHPTIHNGFYYLNQEEHFLYADDTPIIKNAEVLETKTYSFPYVLSANVRQYYEDLSISYADQRKEDWLAGTFDKGISLSRYENRLSLESGQRKGVYESRTLDFLNLVKTWEALQVEQDDSIVNTGSSLSIEIGTVDESGVITGWYPQTVGEPIALPQPTRRVKYRIKLNEGSYRNDYTEIIVHDTDRLEGGLEFSDKIKVEETSIEISDTEYFSEGRYIARAYELGGNIVDMGTIEMDIYLPEGTSVKVYTASSNNVDHDFSNPTDKSPWIPVQELSKIGDRYVFRNRAPKSKYFTVIVELIAHTKDKETYAPVVSNIVATVSLYTMIYTTPVISKVFLGGQSPSGYVDEEHMVSLSGTLDTDGGEYDITVQTPHEIMSDYLISINQTNLNNLTLSNFQVNWDKKLPVNLFVDPDGHKMISGFALKNVGDVIVRSVQAYFDEVTKEVLISPVPQMAAPIIVKNAQNLPLRYVNFRDKNSQPTLTNKEVHVTDESRYIFLQHRGLDPESLRVWIDINENNEWMQILNCNVVENRLVLPDYYEPGKQIEVQYKLKNSFTVNYNHATEIDTAQIKVHTNFDARYPETRRLKIHYEVSKTTAYRSLEEIDMNPLHTRISNGFIYLSDTIYPPYNLELNMNPTVLSKSKMDKATLTAHVLDEFGNPVVGEVIQFGAEIGSVKAFSRYSDRNGMVAAQYTAPQGVGESEDQITVVVVSKDIKHQLSESISIGLITEETMEKISIIPEVTETTSASRVSLKVVALGGSDERISNRSINLSTSSGTLIPSSGTTNGEGEFFAILQAPDTAGEELIIITAEVTNELGTLIQEQTLIYVTANTIEVG